MFLPLILLFCIAFYKIKFSFSRQGFENYLYKDNTTSIKGICICLVFISHFSNYVTYSFALDNYAYRIVGLIGQAMVVPFLFYSGYGVMLSIINKGKSYVKKMPKHRLLNVLIKFEIIVIIKLIVDFIINNSLSLEYVAVCMLSRNDWYILAIMFLYTFTYLSYMIFGEKQKYRLFLISTFLLSVCYIFALKIIGFPRYYYDSILCYFLGILWAVYKQKIDKIALKNIVYYLCIFFICSIILFIKAKLDNIDVAVIIYYSLICVLIILITKKVQIHNKILRTIGNYLFDIYLVHRIPMDILYALGLAQANLYLYFALCVVFTGVLAYLSNILINNLLKKVLK